MTSRLSVILSAVALSICAVCGCAPTAPPPEAELPEAVREHLQQGTMAAERGDLAAARNHFLQAYHDAPGSHLPLYSLALTEDHTGGHEMQAIAWYRAYLAAAPQSENRETVLGRVRTLDDEVADQIGGMISRARRMDSLLTDDIRRGGPDPKEVRGRLDETAQILDEPATPNEAYDPAGSASAGVAPTIRDALAWTRTGEAARARSRLREMAAKDMSEQDMVAVAVAQARVGDPAAAMQTADRISDSLDRVWTWSLIAEARGDLRMAEILDWAALAEHFLGGPMTDDPGGTLAAQADRPPEEIIDFISRAARNLAAARRYLRRTEAYWQQRRAAPAAG